MNTPFITSLGARPVTGAVAVPVTSNNGWIRHGNKIGGVMKMQTRERKKPKSLKLNWGLDKEPKKKKDEIRAGWGYSFNLSTCTQCSRIAHYNYNIFFMKSLIRCHVFLSHKFNALVKMRCCAECRDLLNV